MSRPTDDKASQEWQERETLPPMAELDRTTLLALASQYVPGSREEKRLLRKLDLRVIVSIIGLLLGSITDTYKALRMGSFCHGLP
jgi:hypothetical protein